MRRRYADVLILALVLLIFWTATFYQIRLPGLYYDEAADVVPAMQIVQGAPNPLDMAQAITLGPLRLPVMVMVYVGAVSTYAVLPFYWLFGVGVEATRAMTIFMASLGMVFGYFFLKDLFGRRVAALSILLVAIHPAFVFWSRTGIYVSSPMVTMATGSLFCLSRWRRGGQARYLYAAALLMGIGLSAKLLFLWFILAVLGASLLLGLVPRLHIGRWTVGQDHHAPELTLRNALIACLAFVCGAWMIIWYNLTTQGTIRFVLDNMLTTGSSVNNLDIFGNLRTEVTALSRMLDGSWFSIMVVRPAITNHLFPVLFCAALAILIVSALRRDLPWPWRRVAFIILLMTFIWVQSAFTVTSLGATHLYILYPFPQTLIVLAALTLATRYRAPLIALATVLAVFASDGWAVMDHHRTLAQSGGTGRFSDAIYDLATDLQTRPGVVAAADWGFRSNVAILSQGGVWPVEVFGSNINAPQADFAESVKPYLARSDAWILFHSPQHTAFKGRFAAASKLVAEMQRKLSLVRTFTQRDGTATIYIYRTEAVTP